MNHIKQPIIAVLCAVYLLTACQNTETANKETIENKVIAQSSTNDSTAITETLHGFFSWYEANEERISKIDYINDKGKHLTLDEKQLQAYLAEVKKSGFVSDEFVADEIKFYQACAKAWQHETTDEVNTGLDADRYHCAQDFVAPYNTGLVTSKINGDRAHAVLTLSDGAGKIDIEFEMKKENEHWLLAKLGCDMGVKY